MGRASFPLATLALAGALAGCGGGGGGEAGDTAGPSGAATGTEPKGDLIAGRDGFMIGTDPRCGECHALADAGMTAKGGSDLDAVKPTFQQVLGALDSGPGAMPKYNHISMEVKRNIAAYVEYATHGGG